jgi:hypothetical protein
MVTNIPLESTPQIDILGRNNQIFHWPPLVDMFEHDYPKASSKGLLLPNHLATIL